jgi:hypothetical protein
MVVTAPGADGAAVVNLGAATVGMAAVFAGAAGVAAVELLVGIIPAWAGFFFIFISRRRVHTFL